MTATDAGAVPGTGDTVLDLAGVEKSFTGPHQVPRRVLTVGVTVAGADGDLYRKVYGVPGQRGLTSSRYLHNDQAKHERQHDGNGCPAGALGALVLGHRASQKERPAEAGRSYLHGAHDRRRRGGLGAALAEARPPNCGCA